jgi:hypothetical protein
MNPQHLRPASRVWLLAAGLGICWAGQGVSGPCQPVTIGVDTTRADTLVMAYFCRGFGQTFLAPDTLIQSLSIWRPAQPPSDGQPRYLFITETDSLGRPAVQQLILGGPSLVRLVGDGVHPVEYRFEFDPPFALPHRGKFFFVIQADFNGAFAIPAATTNPYPDGEGWETGPRADCFGPGSARSYVAHPDLAYTIQFCRDVATSVRRRTWGQLKAIYR